MKNKLRTYFYALRINQWLKNFVIFTAIIFSGQLFHWDLLLKASNAFIIFCLLSSTSYVLNDIIDYPYDKQHPVKKNRPVASGDLSLPEATFIVFVLSLVSLILALFFSLPFFFLSLFFILLHFFYSFFNTSLSGSIFKNFNVINFKLFLILVYYLMAYHTPKPFFVAFKKFTYLIYK